MKRPVNFFSGPGYKLKGILHVPDDIKQGEKRPGIALCQGYAGTKEMVLPPVAERLMQAGFVALTFDYRGFGESEGPRDRLIPLEQVDDIRNAMTFLETVGEVDEKKLGLWGNSFGGANVVYAAALDKRAKCVASNIGIGNGERWLHYLRREWEWREFLKRLKADRQKRVTTGESERVHPYDIMLTTPEGWQFWEQTVKVYPDRAKMKLPLESADAIIDFKPEEVVHKISPRPILFVSAEEDGLTPTIEQATMFERAGEPKKFVLVPGVDHHALYNPPHFDKFMKLSIDWFNQYLVKEQSVW